jgi:hypothetical protein
MAYNNHSAIMPENKNLPPDWLTRRSDIQCTSGRVVTIDLTTEHEKKLTVIFSGTNSLQFSFLCLSQRLFMYLKVFQHIHQHFFTFYEFL